MKKLVMFGVCNALLLSMSIGTPILTSGSFTQKQAEPIKNMCLYDSKNNICKRYSDADHDSICDNCQNISHNKNHHTKNKKQIHTELQVQNRITQKIITIKTITDKYTMKVLTNGYISCKLACKEI